MTPRELIERGRYADALVELHALRQAGATDDAVDLAMGLALLRRGEIDRAEPHLERARQAGFEAEALTALGEIYRQRGDLDRAAAAFNVAHEHLRVNPDGEAWARCVIGLAAIACTQSDFKRGHALATSASEARATTSAQVAAHLTLAICHRGTGDLIAAERDARTAISLAAKLPRELAEAYLAYAILVGESKGSLDTVALDAPAGMLARAQALLREHGSLADLERVREAFQRFGRRATDRVTPNEIRGVIDELRRARISLTRETHRLVDEVHVSAPHLSTTATAAERAIEDSLQAMSTAEGRALTATQAMISERETIRILLDLIRTLNQLGDYRRLLSESCRMAAQLTGADRALVALASASGRLEVRESLHMPEVEEVIERRRASRVTSPPPDAPSRSSSADIGAPSRSSSADIEPPMRPSWSDLEAPSRRTPPSLETPARRSSSDLEAPTRRSWSELEVPSSRRTPSDLESLSRRTPSALDAPSRRTPVPLDAPTRSSSSALEAPMRRSSDLSLERPSSDLGTGRTSSSNRGRTSSSDLGTGRTSSSDLGNSRASASDIPRPTVPDPFADPTFAEANWRRALELVLETRRPTLVESETATATSRGDEDLRLGTALVTPLRAGNHVIGALYVDKELCGGLFTSQDLDLLAIFAAQLSTMLQNVRAAEELRLAARSRAATLEAISDGVLSLDRAGLVTSINARASRILGVAANARPSLALFPDLSFLRATLERGEEIDGRVTRIGAAEYVVNARIVRSDQRDVAGVVVTLTEMKRAKSIAQRIAGSHARYSFADLIGEAPVLRARLKIAEAAARSDSNVLITGESGTGKEVVAQAIHNASARTVGPFVGINCSAIPRELLESELFGYESGAFTGARRGGQPGKFELAEGGTILLDEIGDMPLEMQAKLLRMLQERRVRRIGAAREVAVDARVIATTHRDLDHAAAHGHFRADLLFRLKVIHLALPSLRERSSDIPVLVEHFLRLFAARLGKQVHAVAPGVMAAFQRYAWPGNIRELENVLEAEVNLIDPEAVVLEHVPDALRKAALATTKRASLTFEESERELLVQALTRHHGSIPDVARALGVSRGTVYNKLNRYGIDPDAYR